MNYFTQSIIIILLFLGLWTWIQVHKQPEERTLNNSIIVGTNAEYPPFTFIDNGEYTGLDIDIIREIARRLNKKLTIKDMPFDALLPDIQLGNIHMIAAGVSPSEERKNEVFFTKPYLGHDPLVIVTRYDKAPLTSVGQLAYKDVVVNDGFTADLYLSPFDDINLKRLPSVAEAFLALTSKRADAFVSAQSSLEPFFAQYDRNLFHVYPIDNIYDEYVLMISKRYPALYKEIEHTLENMHADGTIAKLLSKWNLS